MLLLVWCDVLCCTVRCYARWAAIHSAATRGRRPSRFLSFLIRCVYGPLFVDTLLRQSGDGWGQTEARVRLARGVQRSSHQVGGVFSTNL